jgi:E3 ubiquitin-protein ligase TRAF7
VCCKFGVREVEGQPGTYEQDPDGCPAVLRFCDRRSHAAQCGYVPVQCPHSRECGKVQRRYLAEHVKSCTKCSCPHRRRGCDFRGTPAKVEEHRRSCRFDGVQGMMQANEERLDEIAKAQTMRDQEVVQLRQLVLRLSQRLEQMETVCDRRLGQLEANFTRLNADFQDVRRTVGDNARELSSVMARLDLAGGRWSRTGLGEMAWVK